MYDCSLTGIGSFKNMCTKPRLLLYLVDITCGTVRARLGSVRVLGVLAVVPIGSG